MKCPNCGFDRILPMYKVCPKCKQPLNAPTAEASRSNESQQTPDTKLFTGIFWSYPKAIKDPEKFKEYAKKNPNDSARLINKWKEQGNDVSVLADVHPMNLNISQEGVSTPHSSHTEKPVLTAAPSSSSLDPVSSVNTKADVNVLSVGKDHKKHYVSWTIAPGQIARNISAQEFIEMSDADGVYVQEGVTAILFIDGVEAAEMEGGVYSFATEKTHNDVRKEKAEDEAAIRAKEGLVQKLGRIGRSVAHFFYHSHDAIREERNKEKERTEEHIRRITSKSVVSVVLKRDGVVNFTMGIRPVTSEDGSSSMEFGKTGAL